MKIISLTIQESKATVQTQMTMIQTPVKKRVEAPVANKETCELLVLLKAMLSWKGSLKLWTITPLLSLDVRLIRPHRVICLTPLITRIWTRMMMLFQWMTAYTWWIRLAREGLTIMPEPFRARTRGEYRKASAEGDNESWLLTMLTTCLSASFVSERLKTRSFVQVAVNYRARTVWENGWSSKDSSVQIADRHCRCTSWCRVTGLCLRYQST